MQSGIKVSELQKLHQKVMFNRLNGLSKGAKHSNDLARMPIVKDITEYGGNKKLNEDCESLSLGDAVTMLEEEVKLILKINPEVFIAKKMERKFRKSLLHSKDEKKSFSGIRGILNRIFRTDNSEGFEAEDGNPLDEPFICDDEQVKYLFKVIDKLVKRASEDNGLTYLARLYNIVNNIVNVSYAGAPHVELDNVGVIVPESVSVVRDGDMAKCIGAVDVMTSVCVAIKDVETGKIYFANVNEEVSCGDLKEEIKTVFGNCENLVVRIFGGARGVCDIFNYQFRYWSEDLLESAYIVNDIINALPHDAILLSADIGTARVEGLDNQYAANAFTLDLQKFEVSVTCPTFWGDRFSMSRYKRVYPEAVQRANKSLEQLDHDGQLPALCYSKSFYDSIMEGYENKKPCIKDMEELFGDGCTMYSAMDQFRGYVYDMLVYYERSKTINALMKYVKDEAEERGIDIVALDKYDDIKSELEKADLYIATSSCPLEANKGIVRDIQNDLSEFYDSINKPVQREPSYRVDSTDISGVAEQDIVVGDGESRSFLKKVTSDELCNVIVPAKTVDSNAL